MFQIDLIVRPRSGVRDPQADAVEESLHGLGHSSVNVNFVGRYLQLTIDAQSEGEAKEKADDMCRRLLVNPNLESYELTIKPKAQS